MRNLYLDQKEHESGLNWAYISCGKLFKQIQVLHWLHFSRVQLGTGHGTIVLYVPYEMLWTAEIT